jgi:hypothetical protein
MLLVAGRRNSLIQIANTNDELWGDLGLGLSDNWDVAASSTSWMA